MLIGLSIHNIVLIKRLELDFSAHLTCLTGETGAGKSILLDSLNLALGRRAEARLVAKDAPYGEVAASFSLSREVPPFTHIHNLLQEAGIEVEELAEGVQALLILRRKLDAGGKSSAYLNDRPISVGLLRQIGDYLVEIQGQDDRHGLMDAATHQDLLDAYGGLSEQASSCKDAYHTWREVSRERATLEAEIETLSREREFIAHAVGELSTLAPKPNEAAELSDQYHFLKHAGRLLDDLNNIQAFLNENEGAEGKLAKALRMLERFAPDAEEKMAQRIDPIVQGLERAFSEVMESGALINELSEEVSDHAHQLEKVESRLFRYRDLARKYHCSEDSLTEKLAEFEQSLEKMEHGTKDCKSLQEREQALHATFLEKAHQLSEQRKQAALSLEQAVNGELPALKLPDASFMVHITPLPEPAFQASGGERIIFHILTNPGATPGPMQKIASGGELSRFLLALKVTLANTGSAPTLIFDEVDSGIGGATAAAVGERLHRLAEATQVLVVTHSPQVAARAASHFYVNKQAQDQMMTTHVSRLDQTAREEEIARMLSGAVVTEQALAAAKTLMKEI